MINSLFVVITMEYYA